MRDTVHCNCKLFLLCEGANKVFDVDIKMGDEFLTSKPLMSDKKGTYFDIHVT
jgi:hypothetical protein